MGDEGAVTVTVAEADFVVSATEVATTVTIVEAVTVGALKSPVLEIVPAEADQVTEVFVLPVTVAVNCWVPPEGTVAEVGERETAITLLTVTTTAAEVPTLPAES